MASGTVIDSIKIPTTNLGFMTTVSSNKALALTMRVTENQK